MAAPHHKVPLLLLLLLLLLLFFSISCADLDLQALLDRQEAQLSKLQSLVDTLSRTVSRLEASLSDVAASRSGLAGELLAAPLPASGVAVTRSRPSWAERFRFVAAVRLEAGAKAVAVLPYVDPEGLSKYVAVGDSNGQVRVFSASFGDLLLQLPSSVSDSPVTAMASYLSFRKNESFVLAGRADGSIAVHRVWETVGTGDDWASLTTDGNVKVLSGGNRSPISPVVLLEVYPFGRARFVLASDSEGRIRVFTEDGALYSSVAASSRPLAFMKQSMVFLTERGIGWLDLRRMEVKQFTCEGLNQSVVESYVFDVSERSKAYGFTSDGELIHVAVLGEAGNFKCSVRAVRRLEIEGPFSVLAIRGYLLVVNHEKVFLYNVSSQYHSRVAVSRPIFSANLAELRDLSLDSDSAGLGDLDVGRPLIAGDREKLVVLGLGGGYVGIYQSNFPAIRAKSNAMIWSSPPALLFIMLMIGLSYIYVKKKALTGLTSDDSSFSLPADAPSGVLSGERAFAEDPRGIDLRDKRGGVLRDPTRRYQSPSSRYSSGAIIPYRSTPVDPGFEGGTNLKYRGAGVEPTGFSRMREPLFANTKEVDDHID